MSIAPLELVPLWALFLESGTLLWSVMEGR